MIRVVIADDHQILREGLKQLLLGAGDLDVVGEAADGNEVLHRIRTLELDVLLLDMSMPGKSGVELIKQVKAERPKLRIMILSMHEEHQYAVRAIRAGASGYLTKESAAAQLTAAIRKVAAGGAFITPEVAERLALDAMPNAEGPLHAALSDREFQVFNLLVSGLTVTEIAARLHLSAKTVSTHKARLMEKLQVDSNAELVHYAVKHRLSDGAS
jgi:DNA-binding NarL/FixJ family response regulator